MYYQRLSSETEITDKRNSGKGEDGTTYNLKTYFMFLGQVIRNHISNRKVADIEVLS